MTTSPDELDISRMAGSPLSVTSTFFDSPSRSPPTGEDSSVPSFEAVMRLVVVSEAVHHVRRDESYCSSDGPAIPSGVMHGKAADATETVCGRVPGAEWREWPALTFPRAFGRHCPDCLAQQEAA